MHHNVIITGTGISQGQKAFIVIILTLVIMQNAHHVSNSMDANVMIDMAENRGVKDLQDIKCFHAIVSSMMNTVLVAQPNISFGVAAHCRYNSPPFTSHHTAAKRGLRYLNSTAHNRLHFSSSTSTGHNDQFTGYRESN